MCCEAIDISEATIIITLFTSEGNQCEEEGESVDLWVHLKVIKGFRKDQHKA